MRAAGYFARLARFFFGFGVNGAGGVFSIRRRTSFSVGVRCFFAGALFMDFVRHG